MGAVVRLPTIGDVRLAYIAAYMRSGCNGDGLDAFNEAFRALDLRALPRRDFYSTIQTLNNWEPISHDNRRA